MELNMRKIGNLERRAGNMKQRALTVEKDNPSPMFLKSLDEMKEELNTLLHEVMATCTEEEEALFNAKYDVTTDLIFAASAAVSSKEPSAIERPTSSASGHSSHEVLRLPALELPKFSGKIIEWPTFSQLFTDGIASYTSLTSSQKLQFLNNCLTGEAKTVISFFTTQPNAFQQAWERLESKYNRKQEIVYNLIEQLFAMAPCTQPHELEKLADKCIETRRGLENLELSTDGQDHIWSYVLISKLDAVSKSTWLVQQDQDEIPKTEDFLDFLYKQARNKPIYGQTKSSFASPPQQSGTAARKCPECLAEHPIYRCPLYVKANVDEKWSLARKHRLCTNCLRPGHHTAACTAAGCFTCGKRHNRSLHKNSMQTPAAAAAAEPPAPVVAFASGQPVDTLLGTLQIHIADNTGRLQKMRGFLDSGAQVSLMSKSAFERLNVRSSPPSMRITGVNGAESETSQQLQCNIQDEKQSVSVTVTFHVIDSLCAIQETNPMLSDQIKNRKLADPHYADAGPTDVILGLDVHDKVILGKLEKHGSMFAMSSVFGWILFGSLPFNDSNLHQKNQATVARATLNQTFTKFWEIEELPAREFLTQEEEDVEAFTKENTTRLATGRFSMKMPLTKDPPEIGATRHIAFSRLKSLENKFIKNQEFKELYHQAIQEFIDNGHLERAPLFPENPQRLCYLPHQGVMQPEKSTKLRVVFDASSKSSNGLSLNDNQPTGPKLLSNLFEVLLRFRTYPIAITADIKKMYLQIQINEEDRDLQRVLWRTDPSLPIEEWRLTVVAFGQKAAPYMAIKALHFTADKVENPKIATILRRDFYVDDLITGADTEEEAKDYVTQIQENLAQAGFQTHKWTSNCPEAISQNATQNENTTTVNLLRNVDDESKTLGILWCPSEDRFRIKIAKPTSPKNWTRRTVLSLTNGIYDPLGCLAPSTLIPKLFIQSLCEMSPAWDKPLSFQQQKAWSTWINELPHLEDIKIKRHVWDAQSSILCCFADASEKAYGAAIYAVSYKTSPATIDLLTAKTRVAPLKTVSTPRLELLAAVLATKLAKTCQEVLHIPEENIYMYTDSTITLAWIKGHPSRWNTFVANRVSEIQSFAGSDVWQHVKSQDNPADLASRGVPPSQLSTASLWWNGPEFLKTTTSSGSNPDTSFVNEEQKPKTVAVAVVRNDLMDKILSRYGSYKKLQTMTKTIMKCADHYRKVVPSTNLYHRADMQIVKWVQEAAFGDELNSLSHKKPVKMTSPLAPLNPILIDGIIRVGGRLRNANMSFNQKHPIIMPAKHHVTKLLIINAHESALHAGPTGTLQFLRSRFWILHGQSTVKAAIRKCILCAKCKASSASQMMADLPTSRVRPVIRAFTNCGVDFAGPFTLKTQLSRGAKTYKAYIALFVCMSTRALHAELVTSLSADAFLAAFTRFTSRRGTPLKVQSDNGTNFTSANKCLQKLMQSEEITSPMMKQGIDWTFNPPGAPHFGGLWEAGVKSVKYHLTRVVGSQILTYEEFNTIITRIEAVLNSRPLMPVTNDPDDISALTPAHFLIGSPLISLPEADFAEQKMNALSRWQLIQKLSQDLWKRWSTEFLSRLQQRPKWWRPVPNIATGTLVLINEPNRPPLDWRLGRVIKVYPAADGKVRVAVIRTVYGEVTRPIHKLSVLPLDGDDVQSNDSSQAETTVQANEQSQAESIAQSNETSQAEPTIQSNETSTAESAIESNQAEPAEDTSNSNPGSMSRRIEEPTSAPSLNPEPMTSDGRALPRRSTRLRRPRQKTL